MKTLVNLERLKQALADEFGATLKAVDSYLQRNVLNTPVSELNEREIRQITTNANGELRKLFGVYVSTLKDNWRGLFDHRYKLEVKQYHQAFKKELMTPKSLLSYADKAFAKPLNLASDVGISLDDMLSSFEKNEADRITRAIRLAYNEGLTHDKLVQMIRGSRANRYEDGILAMSTRNAKTIARTGTAVIANEAKYQFIRDNLDIIKGIKVLATLDRRTSPICRHLDHVFMPIDKAKYPPYHYNCRSSFEIVYDEYTSPKQRASEHGVVDNQSYYEWLKSQDMAYIQSVLGKKKAELFMSDGMTVEKFKLLGLDRSFMPMGLDELVKIESMKTLVAKTVDFSGVKVNQAEVKRLLVDLLDGKPKLNEAYTAAEYQAYFGVTLSRPKPEHDEQGRPKAGFDFWIDGKERLDFMYTMYGVKQDKVDKFNLFFNIEKEKIKIQYHLDKADIIPLDVRYLSHENRSKLLEYVLSLPKEQQRKIILIEGEK